MAFFFFLRQFFFSKVECSVLMYLKKREKKAEIPMEILLSSLCFVCELEVLRNYAGSSQLSFPHSVSLLTEGCLLLFLSAFQWFKLCDFLSVYFRNEMHLSKATHRNVAMNIWIQTAQALGKDFDYLPMRSKLRLRGRGLLLQRYICFFFFFFSANIL